MTEDQAYAAMYIFLKERWERTDSDELAAILSDISLLPEGGPADDAVTEDWKSAVAQALQNQPAGSLAISNS